MFSASLDDRFSVSRAANADAAGNQQGLNDGSTGMLQVSSDDLCCGGSGRNTFVRPEENWR